MAFQWQIKRWANAAEFAVYLSTLTPPSWLKGITFHHTAAPTRAQWQGMQHMSNLGAYYRDIQGWPSGPNLFLAAETTPGTTGIFQGTPITLPGTHAGPCNSSRLGIEIVGNYSVEPWPAAVGELVYDTMEALCRWANLPAREARAHRECMPGHTACPGKLINPDAVRAELARRLAHSPGIDYVRAWGTRWPYFAQSGIAALWRSHYQELGEATSDEHADSSGLITRHFVRGYVSYTPGDGSLRYYLEAT